MTDTPEQVATRSSPRSAPRFAGFKGDDSSTYVIYVDSRVVTDTPFFFQGTYALLCFALFYVLNLEYCKQAKEVCLFIQECVFSQPLPSVSTRQKSATSLVPRPKEGEEKGLVSAVRACAYLSRI